MLLKHKVAERSLKLERGWDKRLEEEITRVSMTANKEIETLRDRLNDCEMKLERDRQEKNAVQENLKNAF